MQLHEVYAALGDSMQKLFSLGEVQVSEFSERHTAFPCLAAFFTARLAVTYRDLNRARHAMNVATMQLGKLEDSDVKRYVQSYVQRGYGVFEGMHITGDRWTQAM